MIILYNVRTDDMDILDSFYLVTFDDTSLEVAWGVGPTPEAALKDAERKWDLESETEERKDNPFREVLEFLSNEKMPEIKMEIEEEEDGTKVEVYKCGIDGEVLWRRYPHNYVEVIGNSCEHFRWEMVGNGCYPFPLDEEICRGTDELVEKSIKKIDEGTSIWFLVPQ